MTEKEKPIITEQGKHGDDKFYVIPALDAGIYSIGYKWIAMSTPDNDGRDSNR